MFSNADEEDLFNVNPVSSSHLASLFGTSMVAQRDSDASLVYTAPKQPKGNIQDTSRSTSNSAGSQSSVMCSKFVEAYKFVNEECNPIGKCGIAIIGNESLKTYELILYKTKQDILSRSKLRLELYFTIQNKDFLSFCDDQKMQWTLHFTDLQTLKEFTEQIKTHGGTIVPNASEQTKVCDKDSSSAKQVTVETVETPDSPLTVRDSDSSDSSNKTKANILSRMAKMGQSIFPANLPKPSKQSDSETDEQTINRKPIKKKQKSVLVNNGDHTPSDKIKNISNQATSEFVNIAGQMLPISTIQQSLATAQVQPFPNQYIASLPNQVMLATQTSPLTDSMHIFIAENRTHNCEMRMNVNQLSSKLDSILLKLNQDNPPSADIPTKNELELNVKELEEKEIMIDNLQEQNNSLQKAISDNSITITNLNKENQNQKEVILDFKQKIKELEESKSSLEELIKSKTLEYNMKYQQIDDLNQTVEDQKLKINNLEKFQEENKLNEDLNETLSKLKDDISHLRAQLDDRNSKVDLFAGKLKQSMNALYQQVMENFEDENGTFQSVQIRQILSQKLKTVTRHIIQEFQKDFQNSN